MNVPEQGGSQIIAPGTPNPGVIHFVSPGKAGKLGVFRIETQKKQRGMASSRLRD